MQLGRWRDLSVDERRGRRGRRKSGAGTNGGTQTEETFGADWEFRRHLIAKGGGGGWSMVKARDWPERDE
jgi:hypothetical protein